MCSNLSFRDVDRILKRNGYWVERMGSTSHVVYSNGTNTISIPGRGSGKDVNAMLIRRIFKENNIKY